MTLVPLQKTRLGTGIYFSLGSICSLIALTSTTGGYFYTWIFFVLICIGWVLYSKKGFALILCCVF